MYQRFLSFLSDREVRDTFVYAGDSLSRLTSFRIGGTCAFSVFPGSEESFLISVDFFTQEAYPYKILGRGSNILASDSGYGGAVIRTDRLNSLSFSDREICAGCGLALPRLCYSASCRGISGFSHLFGIPGSLGGAIYMNAGAYGETIGQRVVFVRAYSPKTRKIISLPADECGFSYRKSLFQSEKNLILGAILTGGAGDAPALKASCRETMTRRRASQPLGFPSAGSIFLRPEKGYAGAMIEGAGLCGLSVGGATVSSRHAGFIVNAGGATATEVKELIRIVRKAVYEKYGVLLETEIEMLGE